MSLPEHLPNHLHYNHGALFAAAFGDLYSITPICLTGEGHSPHLEIRTTHGLRLDVTAQWLAELVRKAPEALAKMPIAPDCSGIVAELGEA